MTIWELIVNEEYNNAYLIGEDGKEHFENGFACPFCGDSECRRVRTRHLLRCKSCKADISATNGTFMHRTRLPLRLWIVTAFLVMSNKFSVSAVTLMKTLGVTPGTFCTA